MRDCDPIPAAMSDHPSVPNQPKTPIRCFRIPDATYLAAQEVAEARGESVSDVVRRALDRYVKAGKR